jgi:hypothetical protein
MKRDVEDVAGDVEDRERDVEHSWKGGLDRLRN